MREEAEKIASEEWPDLQNSIREVAADGANEIVWGVPPFSDVEKDHYYCNHMMDILKKHGFECKMISPPGIEVRW